MAMQNESRGFRQRFVMVGAPAEKVNSAGSTNILRDLGLATSTAHAVQATSETLHYHKARHISCLG
jgi:hypothetical protein